MSNAKASYHHGDLRRALLDAALLILAREGLEGLSLRGIAREAGVSQAAPYSHFKNRDALLAAAAQQGYEKLSRDMRRADPGDAAIDERLMALGVAYVRFAHKNPELYGLMFGSEFRGIKEFEELAASSTASYGIIGGAVSTRVGDAEATAGTLAAWALVHGIADLVFHGRITLPRSAADQKTFIKRILRHLF